MNRGHEMRLTGPGIGHKYNRSRFDSLIIKTIDCPFWTGQGEVGRSDITAGHVSDCQGDAFPDEFSAFRRGI